MGGPIVLVFVFMLLLVFALLGPLTLAVCWALSILLHVALLAARAVRYLISGGER
jgi:low affinity Fe/Cu permease